MTKVKLHIAHQTPGRVRMKIPAAKGNAELLQQFGDAFGKIPGIESITVNPTTGSIVLHYDRDRHDEFHGGFSSHCEDAFHGPTRPPTNEFDAIASKIESEAEFLAEHSASARAVVDFFKSVDREIKAASGNNVDLKIVLGAGIIGFTLLEVGAGAATPVWVTFALFTMNHFIEMHQPSAPSRPRSAPVLVAAR